MTKKQSIIVLGISFFVGVTTGLALASLKNKPTVNVYGNNNTVNAKINSHNGSGNGCGNKAEKTTNKK